jgi:Ca-activated chloride channel family protein
MDFVQAPYLYLLFLLPLVVLVVFWAGRQRRSDIQRLGTPALIAAQSSSVSRTRRRWKTILWFTALIALIIALARPRWGTEVRVTIQEGVQVMVALDVSSSMLAEDIKPNRLARAKLTVKELMDRLAGNELGLVLFSGAAFIQSPLTSDFNTVSSLLEAAGPTSISRPGTALEEAIHISQSGFPAGLASNRIILLLTDGEGHEGDPVSAAQAAAEDGVTIYAIGFGSLRGEPIPLRDETGTLTSYKKDAQGQTVLSRLDEETLRKIVEATNGAYFRASATGNEVQAITETIAALDTGELESQFKTQGVERFEWFAGLALLTLTIEFMTGDRKVVRKKVVLSSLPVLLALLLTACAPEAVRHNNAGNRYYHEQLYEQAIAEYRQAEIIAPEHAEPYYNASNAFNRQGQIASTRAQAQQALRNADTELAPQIWYNLGNAYFDAQLWPEAITAYQEALRLNPNDLDAKHNLELALHNQDQQQDQQETQAPQDKPSENGQTTPTPADQTDTDKDGEQPTPQPGSDSQETKEMTQEQAQRLLQALTSGNETLQERLEEIYRVPVPPPQQDW